MWFSQGFPEPSWLVIFSSHICLQPMSASPPPSPRSFTFSSACLSPTARAPMVHDQFCPVTSQPTQAFGSPPFLQLLITPATSLEFLTSLLRNKLSFTTHFTTLPVSLLISLPAVTPLPATHSRPRSPRNTHG